MCIQVWRKSFRNPAAGYFSVIAHPGIGRSGRTFAQLQAPLATPDCGGWFKNRQPTIGRTALRAAGRCFLTIAVVPILRLHGCTVLNASCTSCKDGKLILGIVFSQMVMCG